ncbi:MAG: Gfo/Idh/MocA family oxidoreductase [Thermoguttaceae bacterium]|nr:Gfo/Idh/MocA family oxidoreductase [Thermoguttaceae bacterium]MDW8078738.1 Gfo/Idh/MocA family oxidoreductase [Thermoguttaceae bacterium]
MQTLRYGIVGGGFVARFHCRALAQVRGIDVVGFVSKDPLDELLAFARNLGLGEPRAFASIREMVPHCDVVAIFAPNFARVEVVEEIVDAVKAGAQLKGLICEKPFARNMPEARRIMDLVRPLGIPTAYFENQIHMKCVKAARQQLEPVMAAMGAPLLVRSGEEHAGPHSGWFWDPTRQGGGVMSDMGCHCLAVGWYALTPPGKPVRFLQPLSVSADLALLKWGQPRWKEELLKRYGVDYGKTPAEDFATGMVTYLNPETNWKVKAQFTVSWMYDKMGLRLSLDGIGPGYAFEMNSLRSPLEVFIGDVAAAGLADTELALEKAQASRGLLAVQPNEADLYGYTDENVDAAEAFRTGRPPLLDWDYGVEITRLTMAAYLSAERRATIDLTDPATAAELEKYIPKIQQGRGAEVL